MTDPWTPEAIKALKVLWDKGVSVRQIARELNRDHEGKFSRGSVAGKARRLDLPVRGSPIKRATSRRLRTIPKHGGSRRHCQWPLGHPGEPGFRFCGAKPARGRPYCSKHCARAYQTK